MPDLIYGGRKKPYMWPTFYSGKRHHIAYTAYEEAVSVRVFHIEGSMTRILLDPDTFPGKPTDSAISVMLDTCECGLAVVEEIEPAKPPTVQEIWDIRSGNDSTET